MRDHLAVGRRLSHCGRRSIDGTNRLRFGHRATASNQAARSTAQTAPWPLFAVAAFRGRQHWQGALARIAIVHGRHAGRTGLERIGIVVLVQNNL